MARGKNKTEAPSSGKLPARRRKGGPAPVTRPAAKPLPQAGEGRGGPVSAREENGWPAEYGVDRAVLLARDPRSAFLYWEVREELVAGARARHGGPGELALRLREAGTSRFLAEGRGVGRTGSWYFRLPRAGMTVSAELGWRREDGGFEALLASNSVGLPRETPAGAPPAGGAEGGGRPPGFGPLGVLLPAGFSRPPEGRGR